MGQWIDQDALGGHVDLRGGVVDAPFHKIAPSEATLALLSVISYVDVCTRIRVINSVARPISKHNVRIGHGGDFQCSARGNNQNKRRRGGELRDESAADGGHSG